MKMGRVDVRREGGSNRHMAGQWIWRKRAGVKMRVASLRGKLVKECRQLKVQVCILSERVNQLGKQAPRGQPLFFGLLLHFHNLDLSWGVTGHL